MASSPVRDTMSAWVERGDLPGLAMLVALKGEPRVDVIGEMAPGGAPMQRDTLFRITSMTKPIAAVAALILVDDGRLSLDAPIDRLLPELAARRVLRQIDGPLDDTVPAERPISLRDLLTFRPGLGIDLELSQDAPILREIAEQDILGFGPPRPAYAVPPDEWLRRLGTLPLMAQPGRRWLYNTGSCILGVLIERAADQPLEDFMRERIFEPLGMRDTGFSVPPDSLHRLPPALMSSPDSLLEQIDGVADSVWAAPPTFPDAAAGLISTIDDYFAFGQMLLDGGKYGTIRIVPERLVAEMRTNQITAEQKRGSEFLLGPDDGWGLGVRITGMRFGWDGGYGTTWGSDPRTGTVAILLTQCAGRFDILTDFWTAIAREHRV